MKFLVTIVLFVSSLFFRMEDLNDSIIAALKQGNSEELAKNFADKVSIKILSQEDVLSKSQSQVLISEFFSQHKVKSFQTSHSSSVNGGSQFITGTLETSNGKFRVSVLVKGNVISQFRIENDND